MLCQLQALHSLESSLTCCSHLLLLRFPYVVYRMAIRNTKLKYPIVPPEGHPDVYTGRMPRPVYEDVQRYPWFFKKKRAKKLDNKKIKKKR
jgi:hypothetical protein